MLRSVRVIVRLSTKKERVLSELRSNPKFDEVFPQLRRFKEPTTIRREKNEEVPFMDTLSAYKKVDEGLDLSADEIQELNYRRFVEGFESPRGPRKYMSEEALAKVNQEIDVKLRELENTGLSREEIVSDGSQKGIPLASDAFFQLIKNNYDARYVYLSPNEEYNARKVVDLALRQDVGKDTFSGKVHLKDNILQIPRSHAYNALYANTYTDLREHVNDLIRDNRIYHLPVKHKKDQAAQNARVLEDADIHWRNVTFLSQFMNKSGKIKNSFQTFLNRSQQNKVARQIKAARNMLLLPRTTYLQEFHKRNLTSLQEDVQDFVRKYVNLENGFVYMSKSPKAGPKDQMLSMGEFNLSQESLKLVKAQIAADRLKQKQLVKDGLDPTVLREKKQEFKVINRIQQLNGKMEFEFLRKEDEIKEELLQNMDANECDKEYEELKKEVREIPDSLFIDAIINENALKLDELQAMKKPKLSQRLTKEESLEVINKVRRQGKLYELSM